MKRERKKLFTSLFVMQVVASFLVCAGHYTASVANYVEPTLWETALNKLSRYGTVWLAMITGFFTVYSLEEKKSSWKNFFKGKLLYIYLPFLVAGVFYHRILHGAFPHFQHHFENILLGNTGMHMYFIFMLCQYYLFAYLFRHVLTKERIWPFLILFLGMQYVFIAKYPLRFDLSVRHFLPTWIFTIYLGHALYWYRDQLFRFLEKFSSIAFLLAGIAMLNIGYFALSTELYSANHIRFVFSAGLILVTALFFLTKMVDKIKIGFRKGLTFYIYLIHSIVILYMNQFVLGRLGWIWIVDHSMISFLYLLGIYMLTMLFSLLITVIIEKLAQVFNTKTREPVVGEVNKNF